MLAFHDRADRVRVQRNHTHAVILRGRATNLPTGGVPQSVRNEIAHLNYVSSNVSRWGGVKGTQTSDSGRGLVILVQETAEKVPSTHVGARRGGRRR
jgi:hypothetical protein